jgi:hypothetical protein
MTPPNLKAYGLWWTDFFTQFQQGAIRGGLPGPSAGVGAAGTAWNFSTESDPVVLATMITTVGVAATVSVIVGNGLANAIVWARQNEIPNPFRAKV